MKANSFFTPKGFTLLEVLVALAILSIVALTVLRATGEGLRGMAENGWKDRAILLGRNQMILLSLNGFKGGLQGNFAPDYPEISWKAKITEIRDAKGRRLEMIVSEGAHEILLEELLFP